MHSRSQKVLAVAFLATALCADRAIAATPALEREAASGTLAGRLVSRLTVQLRRVVPNVRVYQARREETARQPANVSAIQVPVRPIQLSPFEFRLPPPLF